MALTISYRLVGTGWSECTVDDGRSHCTLKASYLSDALGNLVMAASAAMAGFTRLSFKFEEEPGESRWVIYSPQPNDLNLEVFESKALSTGKPDAEGRSIFQTRCLPIEFAKAVHAAAEQVLQEYGEKGYLEKWAEHPFPLKQMSVLRDQIEAVERGI